MIPALLFLLAIASAQALLNKAALRDGDRREQDAYIQGQRVGMKQAYRQIEYIKANNIVSPTGNQSANNKKMSKEKTVEALVEVRDEDLKELQGAMGTEWEGATLRSIIYELINKKVKGNENTQN